VVPVDHSQRLVAAIRRAGGRAELHVYEGAGHGFRAADDQRDELRRVGTFLDQFIPD
jgi:dipeptidyl aminopeptidase/acylaminoacyl peptidase